MYPTRIIQINMTFKTIIQEEIVDYFEEETSIRVQALERTTKLKNS